jgi:hypothetical protein
VGVQQGDLLGALPLVFCVGFRGRPLAATVRPTRAFFGQLSQLFIGPWLQRLPRRRGQAVLGIGSEGLHAVADFLARQRPSRH